MAPVTDIQLQRTREFFKQLRDKPFLAVVYDGDDVHVYLKDVDDDDLTNLLDAIEAAGGEEQ